MATIMDTLNQYGRKIIDIIPYDDCVRAYGPLFVRWYNAVIVPELKVDTRPLYSYQFLATDGSVVTIAAHDQYEAADIAVAKNYH